MKDGGSYPQWHNTVAGGVAGAAARSLVAPLDLLRIRMQLSSVGARRNTIWMHLKQVYTQDGGILSFFRGNLSATYLWIGYSAVQFSLYGRAKAWLQSQTSLSTVAIAFLSGAGAGVCATLLTYPLDMCRTTFAAKGLSSSMSDATAFVRPPKSMFDFAQQLYQKKGLTGFFAGSGPALVQIIPYMGLTFTLYERFMDLSKNSAVLTSGMAGALGGAISKTIVYPLDTTKRRLQAQAFFEGPTPLPHSYRNSVDCLVRMVREEGVASLYKGVVPSVAKTSLASSLSFAFFSMTKKSLESMHDYQQQSRPQRIQTTNEPMNGAKARTADYPPAKSEIEYEMKRHNKNSLPKLTI